MEYRDEWVITLEMARFNHEQIPLYIKTTRKPTSNLLIYMSNVWALILKNTVCKQIIKTAGLHGVKHH